MSYVVMPMPLQPGASTSSAPMSVRPLPAPTVAPQTGVANGVDTLADALMKAKRNKLLSNKLPGTTASSLGLGTGMSDAGSSTAPPLPDFGGNSGPMNA